MSGGTGGWKYSEMDLKAKINTFKRSGVQAGY